MCNKPLSPEIDKCNIQNVLAYWQDDEQLLEKEVYDPEGNDGGVPRTWNYLDHFLACANNPTLPALSDKLNIGCMSKWGGPVQPYYSLGGFIPKGESFPENPEYHKSDAVVMSIIIDNFDPKSQDQTDIRGLERAAEWERVFVEFMHDWEANEMPNYMEIAFNSERSIEDELDKETYGDIVTIGEYFLLSFVMLAYTFSYCSYLIHHHVCLHHLQFGSNQQMSSLNVHDREQDHPGSGRSHDRLAVGGGKYRNVWIHWSSRDFDHI